MPRGSNTRLVSNTIVPDPVNAQKFHTVLDPQGNPFEITAERLSLFQKDGEWLEESEWPKVNAIAVCANHECRMYNVEVDVVLAENVDGVYRCGCGPCGGMITDLYEK